MRIPLSQLSMPVQFAAICVAITGNVASAQSVQIYGKTHLELNRTTTGTATARKLDDSASRLGFRGTEDLGGGLKAQFGLEIGFGADSGALGTTPFRNSYVGLAGPWGSVAMGRLDSGSLGGSPLYSQVQEIVRYAPNDSGATAFVTDILNARNRTSNSIGYASPEIAGWQVRGRYYLRGADTATDPENAARSLDLGLSYRTGPWRFALGAAKDERRGGLAANEFDDKWHFGTRWTTGPVDVYAMVGRDRYNNTGTRRRDVDFRLIGARWSEGPHEVTFNTMKRDVQTSLTGVRKRNQLAYTYTLSKRSELQLYIDRDGVDSSRTNVGIKTIGTALRHSF